VPEEANTGRNVAMDDPSELRAKAAHYRWLAWQMTDQRAREAAEEIAAKLDQRAALMEARAGTLRPTRDIGATVSSRRWQTTNRLG
jgi:hypothetical protein